MPGKQAIAQECQQRCHGAGERDGKEANQPVGYGGFPHASQKKNKGGGAGRAPAYGAERYGGGEQTPTPRQAHQMRMRIRRWSSRGHNGFS